MTRVDGRSPVAKPHGQAQPKEEDAKRREIPWALLTFIGTTYLLSRPHFLVDIARSAPGDLLDTITAIISVLTVGALISALVLSDLACMANHRSFSQTRGLLEVAMRNTGVGALWGSLVAVALGVQDHRISLLEMISSLGTIGALIGLATCFWRCEETIVSSLRETWHLRSLKYAAATVVALGMTSFGLYGYILPLSAQVWNLTDK